MLKQIFILEKYTNEERRNIWTPLVEKFKTDFSFSLLSEEKPIKQFINDISTSTNLPFIIFAHETDMIRFEKRGKLVLDSKSKNIPLVIYSGGSTSGFKLTEMMLEDLNIETLKENIDSFLTNAQKTNSVKNDGLGLLVNIDPTLERLLSAFHAVDPFKANDTLKEAKIPLQAHIAKLIK